MPGLFRLVCLNGILVQLPLPDYIDGLKVIVKINCDKDIDGFHPVRVGKTVIGHPFFYRALFMDAQFTSNGQEFKRRETSGHRQAFKEWGGNLSPMSCSERKKGTCNRNCLSNPHC